MMGADWHVSQWATTIPSSTGGRKKRRWQKGTHCSVWGRAYAALHAQFVDKKYSRRCWNFINLDIIATAVRRASAGTGASRILKIYGCTYFCLLITVLWFHSNQIIRNAYIHALLSNSHPAAMPIIRSELSTIKID